jgi:hypothetical protein
MSEEKQQEVEVVKQFIYDKNIQNILTNINNRLMDFNIFEITGMENQEIKHSNTLIWLFDRSEHNLGYLIFESFLKKVLKKTQNEKLQEYVYLKNHSWDLVIYREENDIDILIVDNSNKTVIAIENKVFANERTNGDDGGQLKKYEDFLERNYTKYNKYFIFLTIDLYEASRDNWIVANHQMIGDVLLDIIDTKEISLKTKIIFESYIDLLKRRGIMSDKKLEELCKKIWENPKYKEAFEIIQNNKPNKINLLLEVINKYEDVKIIEKKTYTPNENIFLNFNNQSPFIYRLMYDVKGKGLACAVVIKDEKLIQENILDEFTIEINNEKISLITRKNRKNPKNQFGYFILSDYLQKFLSEDEITEDTIKQLLSELQKKDEKNFKR